MKKGVRVFVHRCGFEDVQPTICCSAKVAQSNPVDKRTSLVSFEDQQVLKTSPPRTPVRGQNFYWV